MEASLNFCFRLVDGLQVDVVVKVVDLRSNSYRDHEHRGRSLRSYRVETGFYLTFANRLQQACQRYICQWIQSPRAPDNLSPAGASKSAQTFAPSLASK